MRRPAGADQRADGGFLPGGAAQRRSLRAACIGNCRAEPAAASIVADIEEIAPHCGDRLPTRAVSAAQVSGAKDFGAKFSANEEAP
jgi:hypothetical protein